jgi:hypothetical protein
MSEQQSERLVRELVGALVPVRRLPRLRSIAAGVGLLGVAMALWALRGVGLRENLLELVAASPGFLAILLGLGLAAGGGMVATLGASVPGREPVERAGLGLLGLAAVLGLGVGPAALLAAGAAGVSPPWPRDLECMLGAVRIAVLPGAALLWFVARAAAQRPALAVALGSAGAVALGALVMQASCPFAGARHLIVGHALAPIVAATLLALPLSWFLRHRIESA